jgi:hypothetical protein
MEYAGRNPQRSIIQPGEPSQWEIQVPRSRNDIVDVPDICEADGEENE